MRRPIVGSIIASLLLAVAGWAMPTSVRAEAIPWTWDLATASGVSTPGGAVITATCPTGENAVGGVDTSAHIERQDVYSGYSVDAFSVDPVPVIVTAWCTSFRHTQFETNDFLNSNGVGDFGCPSGLTPISANLFWLDNLGRPGSGHIVQSGPETVGGRNEWFVVARRDNSYSYLQVHLQCVSDADLSGAGWVANSQTAGSNGATETVTATCPEGQRLITGGEHVDSVQDISVRSYPAGPQAWTAVADVPAHDTLSVLVLCGPVGDPIADFTSGPGSSTNSTSATFTFTAVDPSAVSSASNYCFLNTNYLGVCSGNYTVTGLIEGQNVFSIDALTADGRGGAPTEKDYYFQVDLTKPTVTFAKVPGFTLGKTVTVKASGTDNQGILRYHVVEIARRASGAGAGSVTPVVTSYNTHYGLLSLPVTAGMSYRFDVTAIDLAFNVSSVRSFSTAAPLDNVNLTASSQWTLINSAVYTNSVVSRTKARGATLTHSMYGKTLGVVATTCSTCGQVGVYAGSVLLTTIELVATATHYRQVFKVYLGNTPVQTSVVLKVLSTNKLVEIDGLGALVN